MYYIVSPVSTQLLFEFSQLLETCVPFLFNCSDYFLVSCNKFEEVALEHVTDLNEPFKRTRNIDRRNLLDYICTNTFILISILTNAYLNY